MVLPTAGRLPGLGFTHYFDDHTSSMVHAFELETCETCGGDVAQANGCGIARADAERFGLVEITRYPAEQYYNEETDKCDCDSCHRG